MRTSVLLAILVLSGLSRGASAATDPALLFATANEAYEAGSWSAAAQAYQELAHERPGSADLQYDLGNALLRDGQLGAAIAAYRRSLHLDPRHRDALANLEFARRSAKDALAPPTPSPVTRTLFFWHHALSPRELLFSTLVANALFWILLIALLFRRRSEWLRWATILVAALLLLLAPSAAIHRFAPNRVAVVLPQEIDALAGTRDDAVVRFKLHAGSELRVLETRGEWLRIALPDGEQGWIRAEHADVV